ncbi:hypothetical protein PHLGIDRAFT_464522 [Phlebiopsis gigantea 11061_1 CR5-6]|uniref:Uncharacterized protein n=1 Tax=Phlebiopsis gigantea (strain 11061_1 CR5-6) TaxID=745531 RepID=A0A0C3S6M1_PHLG1|nr:hypothetical protein PHLGIDRAFT_464522 [Phlebiopsis gigantea 11061_1 CR5-6]
MGAECGARKRGGGVAPRGGRSISTRRGAAGQGAAGASRSSRVRPAHPFVAAPALPGGVAAGTRVGAGVVLRRQLAARTALRFCVATASAKQLLRSSGWYLWTHWLGVPACCDGRRAARRRVRAWRRSADSRFALNDPVSPHL